ncbi:MAG TPA: type II secretion system protein [Steroidobacteraceae bacterium]
MKLMRKQSRGMTLIELIVSITVIAIAGAALMSTLAYLNGTGNTSMLQAQAQSIANAYLNEIVGKQFVADGVEATRAQYDDIFDYNNLDTPAASDERGNAAGNFRVRVAIVPGALNGLPAADVRRIDVTVDYGNASQVIASGYRTRYP